MRSLLVSPLMARSHTIWSAGTLLLLAGTLVPTVAQADKPAAPATPAATTPAAVTPASGKLTLVNRANKDSILRYQSNGTLTMEVAGQKMAMGMKEVEKKTITNVTPSGDVTVQVEEESSEMTMNGEKAPASEDDKKDQKDTYTYHADGTLASYQSGQSDQGQAKTDARLWVATHPVFPANAVAPGDKWSHDYAADTKIGLPTAHADFTFVGREKVKDLDALKLTMAYKETTDKPGLTCTNTLWIDPSCGDVVQADYKVENLRFEGAPAGAAMSGTIHEERIAGSSLATNKEELAKTDPNKPKVIDEVVKDYQKIPGIFTVYRKKDGDKDSIYMEVRDDQLNQLLMMNVTASTGTGNSMQIVEGDPIDDILFEFQRHDDRLMMVVPNYKFVVHNNPPLERAIKRSFPDAYIETFKIEAEQPERKSLLIDVSDLFKGNLAQITEHLSSSPIPGLSFGGGGAYNIDAQNTYVDSLKVFPENLVVETAYHFVSGRAGGDSATLADTRSIPMKINYTLYFLNDTGYKPRPFDPRVGYFTNGTMTPEVEDFSDDSKQDNFDRYIYRWDIQKADPSKPLSPPKKPIVFWLDNAIPVEYRSAVRDGILMWNKAFEKIGIQDAIQVKQMPDNADWDIADMRYNVVRWVVSPGSGYAVSLFRVNPLTGQILNADITIDANLVRFTKIEKQKMVDPATFFEDPKPPTAASMNPYECSMAADSVKQAWYGQMALSLLAPPGAPIDLKTYTHDYLRSVVVHEMGHCLGLRHNFIASTEYSLDQLKNAAFVKQHGTVASVMDYNPFNISALKQKGVPYWTPTIGDYDVWAIDYGYRPIVAVTPQDEKAQLQQIASKDNVPGHAYESDEAADFWDPDVTRFDLGKDPLDYWQRDLDVSRQLILDLGQRVPKAGQSYWEFTQDFMWLLGSYTNAAAEASRYIGGLHLSQNFRGDPGEKPVLAPVDLSNQKRALGILRDYIFDENAFHFPSSYYRQMAGDPYPDMASMMYGPSDYPVFDTIAGIQRAAVKRVFSPSVLSRIVNNEFKVGDPTRVLALPELFRTVGEAAWSELESGRNISALRRELQRDYLDTMIGMALHPDGYPDDARMLAWDQLRQLRTRIESAQSRGHYDEYTRVHLAESLMQINRALNATETLTQGGGGGRITLMDLLGTHS